MTANITYNDMLIFLGKFKTHCITNNSEYEFNHFKNWVKKNFSVVVDYDSENPIRVDM